MKSSFRALVVLGVMALTSAIAVAGPAQAGATGGSAPPPKPVYDLGADPGMVRDGNTYYAFRTGGPLVRVARATSPSGPWTELPQALTRYPDWSSGKKAVWAPDAWHTSAGWVLYFAAKAKAPLTRRCIGVAVSQTPAGPYEPLDTPLVCPGLGADDTAPGRPSDDVSMIDPSPFQAEDGQRYLLYKTHPLPSTIRMFPLSDDGLHGRGEPSRELMRHQNTIENPVMVQRGDQYVLLGSDGWYTGCNYSTVWRRSTDMWSFADKEEHTLLDEANTGICGPGGTDVVSTPNGPDRLFLHGWVCNEANDPCRADGEVTHPDKRRAIYAATLTWGTDGATPQVSAFLPPAEGTGRGEA